MADVSITPANIRLTQGMSPRLLRCGEAGITPMMPLYEGADNKYFRGQANATNKEAVRFFAMGYADLDEYVLAIADLIEFVPGFTTVVGTEYVLSAANPGGITTRVDLATGNNLVIIGYGSAGNKIKPRLDNTKTVLP